VKRVVGQFTPYSWTHYRWGYFGSFKRFSFVCLSVVFVSVCVCVCVLNWKCQVWCNGPRTVSDSYAHSIFAIVEMQWCFHVSASCSEVNFRYRVMMEEWTLTYIAKPTDLEDFSFTLHTAVLLLSVKWNTAGTCRYHFIPVAKPLASCWTVCRLPFLSSEQPNLQKPWKWCTLKIGATVKPLNRGHFGDGPFVPCREVVLFSEVLF